jgi:hypothetical protein
LKNDATDGKNERKIYKQENGRNSTRKFYEMKGQGGKNYKMYDIPAKMTGQFW